MSTYADALEGDSPSDSGTFHSLVDGQQSVAGQLADAEDVFPSWYTPKRLLAVFCTANFLVYLDRGVIASNGVNGNKHSGIQGEFHLTITQDGILPAAFMIGLLIATFLYNELARRFNAFKLIGWGFLIWAAASVGCGFARGFWSLLAWRVLMGAGEASIINLTGPFIDDVAPPEQKTLWFGILFLFNPLGTAAGYIFGGLVGPAAGWRVPFFLQAGIALPVVLWILAVQPVTLRATGKGGGSHRGALAETWSDTKLLAAHPVALLCLFANCPNTGVFGAFAYWGPQAGAKMFGSPEATIDLVFGVATIITAVIATLVGGYLVDRAGSSIATCMAFCGCSALAGFVVIEAAFLLPGSFGLPNSFALFMSLFAVGELLTFAGTAPAMTVQVWAVPLHLRSLSSGLAQVASHALGDVPAPPLVGLIQGRIHNWRLTLEGLTLSLLLGVVLYLAGAVTPHKDYRAELQQRQQQQHLTEASQALGTDVNSVQAASMAVAPLLPSGIARSDRLYESA